MDHAAIGDSDRLAELRATGLLDSAPEEEFDRITRLTARALSVPVSLFSLIEDSRQFFKSAFGLPEPWAQKRETPLSHSFCQHCVSSSQPFIVDDALENPLVRDNLAIRELGVRAYLGAPIITKSGRTLGALCAIDSKPRKWTEADVRTIRDLAETIKVELELRTRLHAQRASSSLQNLILKSAGEAIYGVDTGGVCTFCNPACLELLGYDREDELIGQNMHTLIHHTRPDGENYPQAECRIFTAFREGRGVRVEDEVFWRKDGTSFPTEYWSYPIKDGERILGAVVAFVDITDRIAVRRKLEDARRTADEANRQKTRYLADMSHEIRTPMNAILGFSELLEDFVNEPMPRKYLSTIRRSGEWLLRVLNEVLDLSKIESGKLDLNPEVASVPEMLQSVEEMCAARASKRKLRLKTRIEDGVPPYVVCDHQRVRQILLNLLSNAIKCTTEGGVTLRISAEKSKNTERCSLLFEVSDTGCGIPEEKLTDIFEPFRQVSAVKSEEGEGTGLGLSISSRLANLMNGELSVSSELGKGSVFTLRLPDLEIAKPSSVTQTDLDAGLDQLRPALIFVVDDNEDNRELARRFLERGRHRVRLFSSAPEALEAMRDSKPEAVLMDIRMPGMDGEQARQAMLDDPELRSIPVVAATVSTFAEQESNLRKKFDGYVAKPFTASDLYEGLKNVLAPVSSCQRNREKA